MDTSIPQNSLLQNVIKLYIQRSIIWTTRNQTTNVDMEMFSKQKKKRTKATHSNKDMP
jgi:hypothetical protein